jgi:hypothetical protein
MKRARTLVRLGAIGGAGGLATLVAVSATAPATEGCYTHQCDYSAATIGLAPDGGVVGTGEVAQRSDGTLTWESVALVPPGGQTWTPFLGNQDITFVYGPDAGIPANAIVVEPKAYLAAQADAEANFIESSGQLAEFSNVDTTSVTVLNATCATYYLRVLVEFTLPDAGPADGGAAEVGAAVDAGESAADGTTTD